MLGGRWPAVGDSDEGERVNWLKDTTQSYRRGFVEGEAGQRNAYLLEVGAEDREEYERGFAAGLEAREKSE